MTGSVLHLEFGLKSVEIPNDADISLKKEDYEKARDIGVLSPRKQDFYKIPDSDRVPKEDSNSTSVWVAQAKMRPEYKEKIEKKEKEFQKLIDDIEFLQLQELQEGDEDFEHVAMLDDLADLWEKDLDGTIFDLNEPFGYKACRAEILPEKSTEIVRITIKKPGFYIGSIAGKPANVYIPEYVGNGGLNVHSYYMMDLKYNLCGRNQWLVEKVFDQIPSEYMRIGTTNQTVSYRIPTPGYLIGAIIGKEGRNINNLCQSVKDWNEFTGEVPEFTIKPDGETHTIVDVRLPNECTEWGYSEIEYVVDHMHY